MLRIVLVRPGCTDFDEQGRIKGTLDIPLNENGSAQAKRLGTEIARFPIQTLYTSPCQSAQETAKTVGQAIGLHPKTVTKLANVDHGLWHGRLIDEVRQKQPRVYKQLQEHPESVCPPDGEALTVAQERVRSELKKIVKRHSDGYIAIVLPEPLTTMVRCLLQDCEWGDLWKVECECGTWNVVEVGTPEAVGS